MPLRRDGKRKAATTADKGAPEFWRAVTSGGYIALSDEEAFAASLAAPSDGGSGSVDYAVGEIRVFELRGPDAGRPTARSAAGGGLASQGSYRFIELIGEAGSGPLYLAAVELPDRFELRLYFTPSGLESGTRDELIDRGDSWLFLPPPDPEDFISSELEYAPFPDLPEIEEPDAEGRAMSRKLIFSREGPASLYGESADTGSPVIITEYKAEPPEAGPAPGNPLLLVLEEGWMRPDGTQPDEGGYLTIILGKVMRSSDLEYYPA